MSRKSLKILLILVTILSLISTFSLATDDTAAVTTSDDIAANSEDNTSGTEGETNNENSENTVTEDNKAEVNNDLYLADTEVTISDTVNGNAFVIAETLTVTGQIGGDLFVMAKTINIEGQIYGNVFALADTITLNGLIYDLYATCGTLNVSYDGVAYRDLKVNCNKATINGVIGKNINISTNTSLTLESDCIIYGDLNYSAPNEIEVAEGVVTGNVNYKNLSNINVNNSDSAVDYVLALLMTIIYTLVIWLLMTKLAPKFYGKVTSLTSKKMLLAFVIGLVSIIVIPVVSILLLITAVAAPVALLLMVVYGLVIAISSAVLAITLASKLANKVKVLAKLNNLLAVIIVTIVLWALKLIPVAGGIISFLVVLTGFGMVIMSLFNKKEKTVEKEIIEE